MKWMLVVLVFGNPMQTGLMYDSLDDCLKAEANARAEWSRIYNGLPKKYQDQPMTQEHVAKQMTQGTCIPHV
jgi:hypothetical protein